MCTNYVSLNLDIIPSNLCYNEIGLSLSLLSRIDAARLSQYMYETIAGVRIQRHCDIGW